MKKGIIAGAVITVATMPLSATIYIAPPDIDQYKQKTDQSFYDLYQNKNSVIAEGKNKQLDSYVNNIQTNNKLFTGNTLVQVAQANLQGKNFKANISGMIRVFGKNFKINIDELGNVHLIPNNSADKKYIQGNSIVSMTGPNAIPLSSAKCIHHKKVNYGKSTYTVCDTYSRTADEATFDVVTGKETENIVTQTTNGQYYFTSPGKSTYVHYSPQNNHWQTTETKVIKTNFVNIDNALKNNKIPVINISHFKLKNTKLKNNFIDYVKEKIHRNRMW